MAVPGQTFTAFDAVGNREDLENEIYNISPMATPVVSKIGRTNASNTYHEWQTDALAAAASNRQIEGDDAAGTTLTATTRVGNYCQISRKTVITSGTQDAANSAGRAEEHSYQVVKAGNELKRDIEYAITQNQASSAGGAGTARSLASMESWLATNYVSVGTGTAQTTPGFSGSTVVAPTDSTVAGTFTEASLKTAIANCWTEGGQPNMVVCGAHNKALASSFGGIATQYKDNTKKQATIIGAADAYVSDFGEVMIVPDHFTRTQTVLVLDTTMWAIAYYRTFREEKLAKTGDSEKTMVLAEFTLVAKNEASSSKVADTTTS